jgi:polar amino acid transport system substrate-binding protein
MKSGTVSCDIHAGVARRVDSIMMNLLVIFTCALPMLATTARAEETLLVANVVPFIFSEENATKGVLYEIVHEAAMRVGHSGAVTPMPPRRQAQLARRNADTLTTLLYAPNRQFEYTWLFKLLDDDVVLVSNASTEVDISSVEAARHLRIGVVLGGPSEALVRRLGFSHIEAVANVESNARKLAMGRIDAWAVARGTLSYAQKRFQGLPPWQTGAVLGEYSIYFGGAPGMEPERINLWRQAFESMKRDGRYASILRTYQYTVPGEPDGRSLSAR